MWDHTRIIPQLPATRFDKHVREVLVGIGSNRITIERDGTARAMTLSEQEDWLDWMENMEQARGGGFAVKAASQTVSNVAGVVSGTGRVAG